MALTHKTNSSSSKRTKQASLLRGTFPHAKTSKAHVILTSIRALETVATTLTFKVCLSLRANTNDVYEAGCGGGGGGRRHHHPPSSRVITASLCLERCESLDDVRLGFFFVRFNRRNELPSVSEIERGDDNTMTWCGALCGSYGAIMSFIRSFFPLYRSFLSMILPIMCEREDLQ